jgi:hypothetical protein
MRPGEADMLVRGLKAARQTLFKLQSWRDRLPTEAISVPALRLMHLAGRTHTLGPGPLAEMLIELSAGKPLMPTLEAYSRLYPLGEFIAAFGGDRLPQPRIVAAGGGRR